jgi:nitroimidazol reductase NimA-like FMN-containing flavoprotein (pyridoxamine 5'-phosphate oxidase superfamily)
LAKQSKIVTMSEEQVVAFLQRAVDQLLGKARDNYAAKGAVDYVRVIDAHRTVIVQGVIAAVQPDLLRARQRLIEKAEREAAAAPGSISEEEATALIQKAYTRWVELGRPQA